MYQEDTQFTDELVVMDFFFPEINTAAKVCQFKEIKAAFQKTLEIIQQSNAGIQSILKTALAGSK